MARLSETQTTLLSAAAARENRSLLPPPESLKATGKALDRTLAALVRRGFAAESRTRDEAGAWRRDDQGTQVAGGVYVYRLAVDTFTEARKLLFLR